MSNTIEIRVDAGQWLGDFPHYWNYIGYDECNYTHTPGGMALLKKFGQMEKPYYVRMHHMFCTGILHPFYKWGSTNLYTEDEDGNPIYTFNTVDKILDTQLAAGCKPFFEFGFMPLDLADPRDAADGKRYQGHGNLSEYQRVGWAMPPKDYRKWYDMIHALAKHLKARYGEAELATWYFELWNEPDIFYWRGTHEEFCKLYDYTEAALHAVLPDVRFGGPATTGTRDPEGNATKFLDGFLNHVKNGVNHYSGARGTRIDFTSFHTKGGLYSFDPKNLKRKQLPSVQTLVENVRTQANVIKKYGYDHLECVLSEADPDGWAAGGRFDNFNLNFRNTEYYASYVASGYKNIADLAEQLGMDIRPQAWAFLFEGERCFEGTRTFSTQGIDKPVLNLFRLLARLGTKRLELTSSRDQDVTCYADPWGLAEGPEADGWATMTADGNVQVLVYCHHDDWDVKESFDTSLELAHLPFDGAVRVRHYRVDETHSNAYAEWVRQGQPDWPEGLQYEEIRTAGALELFAPDATVEVAGGKLRLDFPLPVHGISLILIDKMK